tara:strand:- start:206 stop:529 length:324 start_codon:yes stop_codon:yes gene_type:complete
MTTPTKPPPGTTPTAGEIVRSVKKAKSSEKKPGQVVSSDGPTSRAVLSKKKRAERMRQDAKKKRMVARKAAAKQQVKRGKPPLNPGNPKPSPLAKSSKSKKKTEYSA